jgi:DNA-binding XRE family transcriptional regulator
MPRPPAPDLTKLDPPPTPDAVARGVRVVTPDEMGAVVRVMRARALGLQRDAADRLGVSRGMLSDLEQGRGGTQLQLALRVLADLGVDVVLVPRDERVTLRPSGS